MHVCRRHITQTWRRAGAILHLLQEAWRALIAAVPRQELRSALSRDLLYGFFQLGSSPAGQSLPASLILTAQVTYQASGQATAKLSSRHCLRAARLQQHTEQHPSHEGVVMIPMQFSCRMSSQMQPPRPDLLCRKPQAQKATAVAAVIAASSSGAMRMEAKHRWPGRQQAKHSPWLLCTCKVVGHPPILQTCFMCKVPFIIRCCTYS